MSFSWDKVSSFAAKSKRMNFKCSILRVGLGEEDWVIWSSENVKGYYKKNDKQ